MRLLTLVLASFILSCATADAVITGEVSSLTLACRFDHINITQDDIQLLDRWIELYTKKVTWSPSKLTPEEDAEGQAIVESKKCGILNPLGLGFPASLRQGAGFNYMIEALNGKYYLIKAENFHRD